MIEHFSDLRFAKQALKSREGSFSFKSPQDKALAYSRSQNPVVIALCRTLADMQEADDCVVTSYGFGAILTLCLSQLKKGDHILVAEHCFGADARRFAGYMKSYGISVTYVENESLEQWRSGVCSTTRMAFMMTSAAVGEGAEPDAQARRVSQLSQLLNETGFEGQEIQLVVDNTCSPSIQFRALAHGADFVLYTSTEIFHPQSRVVAGAICGQAAHMPSVARCMKAASACVSPFNAWSILRDLGAENNQVLDHILGVGSTDGSDKVVSLRGECLL